MIANVSGSGTCNNKKIEKNVSTNNSCLLPKWSERRLASHLHSFLSTQKITAVRGTTKVCSLIANPIFSSNIPWMFYHGLILITYKAMMHPKWN